MPQPRHKFLFMKRIADISTGEGTPEKRVNGKKRAQRKHAAQEAEWTKQPKMDEAEGREARSENLH